MYILSVVRVCLSVCHPKRARTVSIFMRVMSTRAICIYAKVGLAATTRIIVSRACAFNALSCKRINKQTAKLFTTLPAPRLAASCANNE